MTTIPGTTLSAPANYYNRAEAEAGKGYDEHLFVAGHVGQSAEINEIQTRFKSRLRDLGNHLLKDGDITSGAELIITPGSPLVTVLARAGDMWLYGAVRHVAERSFTAPATGTVQVGVWLKETVITAESDADLRDPAIGLRLVGEVGAARVKVTCTWGHSADGQEGNFYSIYRLLNGVQLLKREPPESNAVSQAIARYDRQSAGNSYASSGFRVTAVPGTNEDLQVYSLSAGVARINGAEVIIEHAQTLEYRTTADLDTIDEEAYDSTGLSGQVVTVRHAPIAAVDRVTVVKGIVDESVAKSTSTVQINNILYYRDILSKTSIVAVSEVKKLGTIYVQDTTSERNNPDADYFLGSDAIVWKIGRGPNPGDNYTVSYTYNKNVTDAATISEDGTGIVIPEANVAGTNLIEVGYQYKLPRIDRVCLDEKGVWHVIQGVSSRRQDPLYPQIPQTYLPLASIFQTWVVGTRAVQNDGPRMVSMAKLENHDRDIQRLYELVAGNNLLTDLSAREPLGRRGLFTDPFLSDSARDTGLIPRQTAQITADATLTLGVAVTEHAIRLDGPMTLVPSGEVIRVEQLLSSDAMQINPYMVFAPPKAYAYLNPWWDFWTLNVNRVLPDDYQDVYKYKATNQLIYKQELGWGGPITTKETVTTTTLVSDESTINTRTSTEEAQYMRAAEVRFTLTNWGSNERVVDVKIDGRSITFDDAW